eukprot:1146846-Pelagomonas_calceolata.AAC.4
MHPKIAGHFCRQISVHSTQTNAVARNFVWCVVEGAAGGPGIEAKAWHGNSRERDKRSFVGSQDVLHLSPEGIVVVLLEPKGPVRVTWNPTP